MTTSNNNDIERSTAGKHMAMLGKSLIGIGVLASLIGIGGFIDTRKVDRRFKTGYKNNEPDLRNFGLSCKILLSGIGLFLVGLTANRILDPGSAPIRSLQPQTETSAKAGNERGITPANITQPEHEDSPPAGIHASPRSIPDMSGPTGTSSEISAHPNDTSDAFANRVVPTRTFVTSFDCLQATYDDEQAICHDPGLAAMDRRLAQLYSTALQNISDKEALRQSESDWITARHQCGKDLDCLRRAYGERIGQFVGSLGSRPPLSVEGN
ncbi:lysozyme inhibitor LprI family protein [Burkholderia territorii]|uniref:lysozyme inhibitor LprI family protein n=1 Tax=Burkholderia territorii TaxID=1503055 RepID=UPI001E5025E0|nr:lysozyme inhibitor LprI family protein [Burkholderia territorii]